MGKPQLVRREHSERLELHRIQDTDLVADFRDSVLAGLSATPKSIPPKYFYDERGSQLFEDITETEEYYPTRTEAEILAKYSGDIIETTGDDLCLVELGSGSSTKTRMIMDAIGARQGGFEYIPIDISPTIVTEFGMKLLEDYPDISIRGMICDYHRAMEELRHYDAGNKLILFLGSSIGNYTPEDARLLLKDVCAAMQPGDFLLIGCDLIKDDQTINLAYNDAAGVTAEFNLNLLTRINRELNGNFDLSAFEHSAFYNREQSRIEMHLVSLAEQTVTVGTPERSFHFEKGESIHTENSYKFDDKSLTWLFEGAGLKRVRQWTDSRQWFALNLVSHA